MRKAAGILMIIVSVCLLLTFMPMIVSGIYAYNLLFSLFVIFVIGSSVFVVTGGVFCLKTKNWVLCLISALLLLVIMTMWLLMPIPPKRWAAWLFTSASILPIVFICLRKREWQEIQA